MPAVASSLIPAALHRLTRSDDVSGVVTGPERVADLRKHLAMVPDPRARRGVRHTLISILLVTAAAVIAGARSFTAVGEWTADAPQHVLAMLGTRWDRLHDLYRAPDESTLRRVLQTVDGALLDTAIGAWLAGFASPVTVIAVDGKTVRGTCDETGQGGVHLLAAMTHDSGIVVSQREVGDKTNEVRREVPCRISHSVRRNSEESSWIRRLTRILKGEGDQSMPVQAWWSCPRVGTVRQGDPRDTANAGLHEAQSPVMQVFIHRKRTCETGAALCVGLFRWLVQPPQRWAMPNEGIEGDEWDAYVTLERATRRKRGIA